MQRPHIENIADNIVVTMSTVSGRYRKYCGGHFLRCSTPETNMKINKIQTVCLDPYNIL